MYGYGDGLIVVNDLSGAKATVLGCLLDTSARAGISNFGGSLELGGTHLRCNPVALDGETFEGADPAFADLGGNVCDCDDANGAPAGACKVLSSQLEPPKALPPGS